jgi:glc operon protein GlcG
LAVSEFGILNSELRQRQLCATMPPSQGRHHMRVPACLLALSVVVIVPLADRAMAQGKDATLSKEIALTRDVKVISSAGARALADACTAWAEKNKLIVATAVIDWGGNLIEFHAMEGAAANAIETALMKARSALRWRRPTSETNKMVRSGENLAPTFMDDFPQPGALPIVLDGQVIGAIGVSSGDGERCGQAAIDEVFRGQAKTVGR